MAEQGGKPAAGSIKAVKEIGTPTSGTGEAPMTGLADGLKAMSEDDIEYYLQEIARGEADLQGLEVTISKQLKAASQRRLMAEKRIAQMRQELDHLSKEAVRAQGEIDGHTRLLVFAEDERRAQGG